MDRSVEKKTAEYDKWVELWFSFFRVIIPSFKGQQSEREVLILINPYAGEKRSRSLYNHVLVPLFNSAQIKQMVVEFHDNLPLRHSLIMNDITFDKFYGFVKYPGLIKIGLIWNLAFCRVVVIGGDGSVSKVINIMIEFAIQLEPNFHIQEDSVELIRDKLKTPLCIIPCGSTNMIANTIYGTTNYTTPIMHLFYG